jgi:hypothetical protein
MMMYSKKKVGIQSTIISKILKFMWLFLFNIFRLLVLVNLFGNGIIFKTDQYFGNTLS